MHLHIPSTYSLPLLQLHSPHAVVWHVSPLDVVATSHHLVLPNHVTMVVTVNTVHAVPVSVVMTHAHPVVVSLAPRFAHASVSYAVHMPIPPVAVSTHA